MYCREEGVAIIIETQRKLRTTTDPTFHFIFSACSIRAKPTMFNRNGLWLHPRLVNRFVVGVQSYAFRVIVHYYVALKIELLMKFYEEALRDQYGDSGPGFGNLNGQQHEGKTIT